MELASFSDAFQHNARVIQICYYLPGTRPKKCGLVVFVLLQKLTLLRALTPFRANEWGFFFKLGRKHAKMQTTIVQTWIFHQRAFCLTYYMREIFRLIEFKCTQGHIPLSYHSYVMPGWKKPGVHYSFERRTNVVSKQFLKIRPFLCTSPGCETTLLIKSPQHDTHM